MLALTDSVTRAMNECLKQARARIKYDNAMIDELHSARQFPRSRTRCFRYRVLNTWFPGSGLKGGGRKMDFAFRTAAASTVVVVVGWLLLLLLLRLQYNDATTKRLIQEKGS